MLNEKAISSRIKVVTRPTGITVFIRSPKNVVALLLLPIWLVGWTIGGFHAWSSILEELAEGCGINWVLGELFVFYALLWLIAGKEIIMAIRIGSVSNWRNTKPRSWWRGLEHTF